MIFDSFNPVNDYNFRAQILGGEKLLLFRVSVANQSAPTALSTVLVYTKFRLHCLEARQRGLHK